MRHTWMTTTALIAASLLALPACDDGSSDETEADSFAIVGNYLDDFMGEHAITAETWTQSGPMIQTSVFHIHSYDNETRHAIAHNDPANMFAGDKYSRFDWVNVDGTLYFCQSAFDAERVVGAGAVTAADDADPATKGCGVSADNAAGFPWSKLTPQ